MNYYYITISYVVHFTFSYSFIEKQNLSLKKKIIDNHTIYVYLIKKNKKLKLFNIKLIKLYEIKNKNKKKINNILLYIIKVTLMSM